MRILYVGKWWPVQANSLCGVLHAPVSPLHSDSTATPSQPAPFSCVFAILTQLMTDENIFHTLPEELLWEVVGFAMAFAGHGTSCPDKQIRRLLSSCSQTCRAWMVLFRPLLFKHLTLRSSDDVVELGKLLSSAAPVIQQYIRHLELREDASLHPWIHIVPRILFKRLPVLTSLTMHPIDISSDKDSRVSSYRHHPSFCRTLPVFRAGLQTVANLTLSSYRFRDFADLAEVISAFSVLEEVHCVGVSWGDVTAAARRNRSVVKGSGSLRLVSAANCADHWQLLWLFAARKSGPTILATPRATGFINVDELPCLIRVVELLWKGRGGTPYISCIERGEGECISHIDDLWC